MSGQNEKIKRADLLGERFDEVEHMGRWLHPDDAAERCLLSRGVAKGVYVVPARGFYARRAAFESLSIRERALRTVRSLAAAHPDWLFCAFSAAMLHGLQVPFALLDKAHIVQAWSRTRTSSVVCRHAYSIEQCDCDIQLGVRVTSICRTLLDCLCIASFREGLAIADSALRWGGIERAELEQYVAEKGRHRKGLNNARRVLRYSDGRSENGGESIARAVMIEHGFVVPELQTEVIDPMDPMNPKRCDFSWKFPDGQLILGELDGMGKYVRDCNGDLRDVEGVAREMSRERTREAHLNLTNAKVVRFTFNQVLDEGYFERLLLTAGVPKRT